MEYRGIFSIARQNHGTHEFEVIGELVGSVEQESPPLDGCSVVGRPNEDLLSFCLEQFTADVVARPLRIIDTATGKTWQENFMLGRGGSKFRLVSVGDVRET